MGKKIFNPNTPKYWDKFLFKENKILMESPFYIEKINKVVVFLKTHSGKFLDIGLGMGNLENKITKERLPIELYGTDISREAILNARKKLYGNFYIANMYKLPFKSSFFDTIAILDVLEHIFEKDTFKVLKETNRVLRKGGNLIVSVPLNENLEILNKEERNYNKHLREYTQEILIKELRLSGFKIKKIEFIYAFKKFYIIKKYFLGIFSGFRKPNLMMAFAQKK